MLNFELLFGALLNLRSRCAKKKSKKDHRTIEHKIKKMVKLRIKNFFSTSYPANENEYFRIPRLYHKSDSWISEN